MTETTESTVTDVQGQEPGIAAPPAWRGADLLVHALTASGVGTLFGVPGDTGVVFYDALHGNQDRIQHVLMRDERHAAKAADTYARVTGRVGAVEVSSGGGTTFVVGGLGEAYASGIPVLLITSDIHSSSVNTGALTEIDQDALFSAVTKWRARITQAHDIPKLVEEAVSQAISGRPGPVALIIPEDVLDELVPITELLGAATLATPATRDGASDEQVAAAVAALGSANFPAIIAGSGVHASGAYQELAELAERLGAPVATTIHGRGVIGDGSDWAVGTLGNNGERPGTNAFLEQADAYLLVGTRGNATDTHSWVLPPRDGTKAVIQIDIDPARAGRNFPQALGIAGDARTVLRQVIEALPEVDGREARRAKVAEAQTVWKRALVELESARAGLTDLPADQLLPFDVLRVIQEALPQDTVIVADPGTPTPNTTVYWQIERPGRKVIIPRGHGPMGYAIPGAVGAAFAEPGRPVVSVTADGSFAMACGELETVARFNLPILFIQFTNNSMGWIKMLQHLYTGQRYFGVDPGPIDAAAVARACGLAGHMVSSLDELSEVVRGFAANPSPTYIDVQVPHMIDFIPPVPAWDPDEDGLHERPVY